MTLSIHLGNGITPEVAGAVAMRLKTMKVADPPTITADAMSSPFQLDPMHLQVTSIVISLISLLLTFRRDVETAKMEAVWTNERLRKFLADELLKFGVIDYDLVSINGFSNLEQGGICKISVREKSSGSLADYEISQSNHKYYLSRP